MGGRLAGGTALAIAAAVTMASGADTADERIGAFVKPFKGTVVLYARNLDTGRDYALGADTKVRTASTIKLPIICALASQVEAGRVKWDDRLIIRAEDKVGGSGVIRELADGTTLSVLDLATLMIVVSDNTATNLILDRISADAVNEYLDAIGLRETRALRKVRGNASSPPHGRGLEQGRRAGVQQALRYRRLDAAGDGAVARAAREGESRQSRDVEDHPRHSPAPAVQGRNRPPYTRLRRQQQERCARRPPQRRGDRVYEGRPRLRLPSRLTRCRSPTTRPTMSGTR